MEERTQELLELQAYVSRVDTETSLLLQTLQWDRGRFMQDANMVECSYNKNHKVPEQTKSIHEKECFFKSLGYVKEDPLLPDSTNSSADNCIKFSYEDVKEIIETAARSDPQFHRGVNFGTWTPPLSASRLRSTYTTDERRVLYDAVIERAPSQTVSESAFVRVQDQEGGGKQKSRLEVLAEQRDMKRRRAKYRVATKSKNYSQVLQEVIRNQMELYAEVQNDKMNQHVEQRDAEPVEKAGRSHLYKDTNHLEHKHREDHNKYYKTSTDKNKHDHRRRSRSKHDERCTTSRTCDNDQTYRHDKYNKSTDRYRSHTHTDKHTTHRRSDKVDEYQHRDKYNSAKHRETYKKDDKYDRRSRYR